AHKLKENKWKDIGSHINNFSTLKEDEILIKTISIEHSNTSLFIYSISNLGRVKKIKLSDCITNRIMPIIYFKLSENELVTSLTINDDNDLDQIAIFTKKNLALRFSIKNIPLLGLKNKGKTCIKLEKKDSVSHILIANESNTIILIGDNGGCKKMKFSDVLLSNYNHYGQPY
ncbi:MAG: hypothetical protein E7Y34_02850, partial [Mycoplasma sp.]|nr:hypothetical protein [Mycoplasma sp.]